MRGDITSRILKATLEGAGQAVDIIAAVLESGYGALYYKLEKNLHEQQNKRELNKIRIREEQKLHSRIYKLKKEGFIISGKRGLSITSKGTKKLDDLNNSLSRSIPFTDYPKESSAETVIISFDIPEKEKYKRNWLRKTLTALGFSMLQKSVWIGNAKLPEEFINHLKEMRIFNYIEISSIKKGGTVTVANKNE